MPVQKAAAEFGIPSGTLYGRCKKVGNILQAILLICIVTFYCLLLIIINHYLQLIIKVGIELSKTAAVHWSDDDMKKALESVRSGGMSINQVGAPQSTCLRLLRTPAKRFILFC